MVSLLGIVSFSRSLSQLLRFDGKDGKGINDVTRRCSLFTLGAICCSASIAFYLKYSMSPKNTALVILFNLLLFKWDNKTCSEWIEYTKE